MAEEDKTETNMDDVFDYIYWGTKKEILKSVAKKLIVGGFIYWLFGII